MLHGTSKDDIRLPMPLLTPENFTIIDKLLQSGEDYMITPMLPRLGVYV